MNHLWEIERPPCHYVLKKIYDTDSKENKIRITLHPVSVLHCITLLSLLCGRPYGRDQHHKGLQPTAVRRTIWLMSEGDKNCLSLCLAALVERAANYLIWESEETYTQPKNDAIAQWASMWTKFKFWLFPITLKVIKKKKNTYVRDKGMLCYR